MLGCSRYEVYFDSSISNEMIFPHKYLLFAGSTAPTDEITPLKLMDEALEEMNLMDCKIVYRPHPWREKRNCYDVFNKQEYKHTILDPQVENDYYRNNRKIKNPRPS
jgi:hypothetical protein